jgi:Flp pilus assembly protein TadG
MSPYCRYPKGRGSMRHFWKNQQGSMIVTMALMFSVLMGFGGLALDIGNLYVIKTRMQNAVDAAVAGGGLELPNTTQATAQARSLITLNNLDPDLATITFNQTAKNPGNKPQINCSMTQNVPTFFMGLFGFDKVTVSASAEAILLAGSAGGAFNYTIFSGSPTNTLLLNGSQTIQGSVHANYKLSINGSSNISGAAEGAQGVNINGSNNIGSVVADTVDNIHVNGGNNIGEELGGASNIAMPDYSQQIADMAAQVYNSSKIFNGSVNVDGNIFVNGNVTLNGTVTSTGTILATGNILVNGSATISGSNQVCLYSENGNITINVSSFNGSDSSAIIYAPNGTITINGSINFHGHVIGQKVMINGSGSFDGANYPVTSLPAGKAHVQLIQ